MKMNLSLEVNFQSERITVSHSLDAIETTPKELTFNYSFGK
jgi:hypothetical protein